MKEVSLGVLLRLLPCGQSIESDRSNDPQCKQSINQSTYWSLRADRSCCCPHQTTQSVGAQYVQYLACLTANSRLGLVLSLCGRQFSAISQHCCVLASVHNDNGPSHLPIWYIPQQSVLRTSLLVQASDWIRN